jgi:hypothetical protein
MKKSLRLFTFRLSFFIHTIPSNHIRYGVLRTVIKIQLFHKPLENYRVSYLAHSLLIDRTNEG